MTSPAGRQIVTTVDGAGRPVQVVTSGVAPTTFGYDPHGHLVSTTQGASTWTSGYDAQGYLASTTDALEHSVSYLNDTVGRPTQTMLADGRLVLTSYDGNSNVTSITPQGSPQIRPTEITPKPANEA